MRITAVALTKYPIFLPRENGPRGRYFRPENRFAANGIAYEVVLRITKDPVRSRKAVSLPRGIAPRPVAKIAGGLHCQVGMKVRKVKDCDFKTYHTAMLRIQDS